MTAIAVLLKEGGRPAFTLGDLTLGDLLLIGAGLVGLIVAIVGVLNKRRSGAFSDPHTQALDDRAVEPSATVHGAADSAPASPSAFGDAPRRGLPPMRAGPGRSMDEVPLLWIPTLARSDRLSASTRRAPRHIETGPPHKEESPCESA